MGVSHMNERAEAQKIIGSCAWCGEDVYAWEDHFEFPDETIVHDSCLVEYVYKEFYKVGE